ncbi:EcsC family protein [Enterobacter ludwigii]|uniref:EcsC family protein n=1 Tax=Enterobacter ludwigii TaxID=299767 RepID=UPI0018676B9E|nr:EcsC family protein [Enterobacter ludwigii]
MENNDEIDVEYDDEMLAEKHTPRSIQAMMGWLYDKAVSGIAGIESAETLAERYLADAKGDVTKAAHAMIRWESVKAGSTGFLSGMGGVVAMPITLPLNITSVLFLQTRLVAAIACLGKRNLADERIRALAGLCLCGNAAKALLQEVALQAMDNWTRPFTRRIVEKTLVLMAARAGVRTSGQFIRLVPLVGGVVSGAVDVTITSTIGRIACTTFLPPYRGQRKS